MQGNLGTIRQPAAKDVLLQYAISGRRSPDDVIPEAGHGAVQALQDLQVVFDRLLDQVVVVPDDRVGSIDLSQRRDIARFERGEEADNSSSLKANPSSYLRQTCTGSTQLADC